MALDFGCPIAKFITWCEGDGNLLPLIYRELMTLRNVLQGLSGLPNVTSVMRSMRGNAVLAGEIDEMESEELGLVQFGVNMVMDPIKEAVLVLPAPALSHPAPPPRCCRQHSSPAQRLPVYG